jgi:Na+/H+-dicarboxylate symporter
LSRGLLHADKSPVSSLLNIGRDLIPTNIVAAAALPNYMGVITFAIVFACLKYVTASSVQKIDLSDGIGAFMGFAKRNLKCFLSIWLRSQRKI